MKTVTFGVEGMACVHCKNAVEAAVKKVAGVSDATADLDKKNVSVICDDTADESAVKDAVVSAGFDLAE